MLGRLLALLFLWATPAGASLPLAHAGGSVAPWSLVSWSGNFESSGTALAATISTGSIRTGDCLAIMVIADPAASISFTDNSGHLTYTAASQNTAEFFFPYYAIPSTGGGTQITANASGGNVYLIMVDEFGPCAGFDTSTSTRTLSSTNPSSGSITAQAKDLLWGAGAEDSSATTIDPGSGFTGLEAVNSTSTTVGAYTNTSGTYRYSTETEYSITPNGGAASATFNTGLDNAVVVIYGFRHQ